jgi:hypothetical protein
MNDRHFTLKHVLVIAVLSCAIGGVIGATFFKKTIVVREGTANTPAAMTSVNLMIDDGKAVHTWNTVSWHEAMSIFDLMETVAATGNITMTSALAPDGNRTVGAINGLANDAANEMRWQYWVNNNYEPRVASKYYLKPGDIVVWKYIAEQPR